MQDVSGPGFVIDMLQIVNNKRLRHDSQKVVVTKNAVIVVLRHLNTLHVFLRPDHVVISLLHFS